MMHGSWLRLLGVGCAVLAGACASGDEPSHTGFSISGNPSQGSNPTGESASSTGTPSTGDAGTTGAPVTTGDEGSTSPATSVTTTAPSTTTTGLEPSTTSDDTTGVMTTMTTGDQSTGDPPDPPVKDPQPLDGLYESCLDNSPCNGLVSDGCFTLTDDNDVVTDGYCTAFCDGVGDCGVKPMCPAVQECLNIAAGQNVCALKCAGVKDCPTGMACIGIVLPNNGSGTYCF